MSDPLVPTASLTLDKERTIRMDLNSLADFERVSGKSVMGGAFTLEQLTISDIRALLWACMVQDDESLSERQVGAMVHVGNLQTISNVLNELFAKAMPEPQEVDANDPLPGPAKKASTG